MLFDGGPLCLFSIICYVLFDLLLKKWTPQGHVHSTRLPPLSSMITFSIGKYKKQRTNLIGQVKHLIIYWFLHFFWNFCIFLLQSYIVFRVYSVSSSKYILILISLPRYLIVGSSSIFLLVLPFIWHVFLSLWLEFLYPAFFLILAVSFCYWTWKLSSWSLCGFLNSLSSLMVFWLSFVVV